MIDATSVIWRRLAYMLTPQLDIYKSLRKITRGKTVLEVGFGTGLGVLQYHHLAEYVDAVEIDQSAVRFARKVLPLRGVRWICDDITKTNKRYKGYDVVVMIEVLEHIESPTKAMRIVKNALSLSGIGIITVPNASRYRRREESLNRIEWTPIEFQEFLEQYFNRVILLNSDLMMRDDVDTRESPIIAGVMNAR